MARLYDIQEIEFGDTRSTMGLQIVKMTLLLAFQPAKPHRRVVPEFRSILGPREWRHHDKVSPRQSLVQ